jgi:hypothetical protein
MFLCICRSPVVNFVRWEIGLVMAPGRDSRDQLTTLLFLDVVPQPGDERLQTVALTMASVGGAMAAYLILMR